MEGSPARSENRNSAATIKKIATGTRRSGLTDFAAVVSLMIASRALGRTAAHTAAFQIGERCTLAAAIAPEPKQQAGNDREHGPVRSPDESGMLAEIENAALHGSGLRRGAQAGGLALFDFRDAHGLDAPAQDLVAHGDHVHGDEEQREPDSQDEQRRAHAGIDRRRKAGRGLVQRIPPVDRELDDGQDRHADECENRRELGSERFILERGTQAISPR